MKKVFSDSVNILFLKVSPTSAFIMDLAYSNYYCDVLVLFSFPYYNSIRKNHFSPFINLLLPLYQYGLVDIFYFVDYNPAQSYLFCWLNCSSFGYWALVSLWPVRILFFSFFLSHLFFLSDSFRTLLLFGTIIMHQTFILLPS